MKVLITGANGFVGGNVSRYLTAHGFKCLALDLKGVPEMGTYAARYTWDALDAVPWTEIDAVLHLAGKAHDTRNASDPQSYFDINVGLTKRILEKCANAGIGECGGELRKCSNAEILEFSNSRIRAFKFIFFSSVKACADTVEGVLTEEWVPNPQTPYGKSKLEAEREVRECANARMREYTDALACYILRPAMIHGPGNKGNLNLLCQVVGRGIPWPLGAFENQRSFTSIENVSRVLEALLRGDVEPGTYQIADDEPLSTNRVISLIAESLGRRPKLWHISCGFMRAVARLGDLLYLPLNSERLKKLTESYRVSNAKLLKALGWKSMPLSAEEGMRAVFVTQQGSQRSV